MTTKKEVKAKKKVEAKKKAPAKKKEVKAKKKVEAKKKAPVKKEKAPTKKEIKKDEFGFRVGSKCSFFCDAIKKKKLTMEEVRELPWNENKAAYNGTFASLKRRGLADKDKKTGKMFIVKK